MDMIENRFTEYAATLDFLEVLGLIFIFLIVSETVWDALTGIRSKWRESAANYVIGIGNVLLEQTIVGIIFVGGLAITEAFAPFRLSTTWWSWVLALIAADFSYYWMHRCEHEIRILWAAHSVHHSSPEFNLTTALRISWIDAIVEWLFFVPMILIGFDLVQTIITFSIVIAYQTLIHTEKVGKLGILDRLFNTPSVHRVHHGSNAHYIDKNYGGILILWDRVFGTFEPEGEKVKYGITTPLGTSNPLIVNFHEYRQVFSDAWHAKSFNDSMGYIFRRPGWQPGPSTKNN